MIKELEHKHHKAQSIYLSEESLKDIQLEYKYLKYIWDQRGQVQNFTRTQEYLLEKVQPTDATD